MKVHGSCHCGSITFEGEVDPDGVDICHCTDCQNLTGSPFRTSVHMAAEQFKLLSGTPKKYVKTGDSGAKRVQAFCAECGSPIYASALVEAEAEPTTYTLRVGTLKERAQLRPRKQIWTNSALPAFCNIEGVKAFPRGSA